MAQINLLLAHPYGNSPQVAANNWNANIDNVKDFHNLFDKPWRKPGADVSDYFNYGFNEDTWVVRLATFSISSPALV